MRKLLVGIPHNGTILFVGELYEDYSFHYTGQMQISCSLPTESSPLRGEHVKRFFDNILPEEEQLKAVATYHRVPMNDTFRLLELLGGDCAGSLFFQPEGFPVELQTPSYRPVPTSELALILRELPRKPVSGLRTRMSLAGAQPKLPVAFDGQQYSIPEGTAASTHILKPIYPNSNHPDLPENEHLCTRFAQLCGLDAPESSIAYFEEITALQTKRYDRIQTRDFVERIHQEDFCQALGKDKNSKYLGSYSEIVSTLRKHCSAPAVEIAKLIRWTLFTYLTGNADAHLKNISLLYKDDAVTLAPFYDLVCTGIYEYDTNLAIPIGDVVEPGQLEKGDWERYAGDIGVKMQAVVSVYKDIRRKADFSMLPDFSCKKGIESVFRTRAAWLDEVLL